MVRIKTSKIPDFKTIVEKKGSLDLEEAIGDIEHPEITDDHIMSYCTDTEVVYCTPDELNKAFALVDTMANGEYTSATEKLIADDADGDYPNDLMFLLVKKLDDKATSYFYNIEDYYKGHARITLDQYELKHKMTPTMTEVFKEYLHHKEHIAYEDILVGCHGDGGKEMTLFNIRHGKAKYIQKIQDEMLLPLSEYSTKGKK